MSRRAPIIAGVVALLLAVLAVVLLVMPKMREVEDTEEQLQLAQDEEIALEAQLESLQQAQAEAPETEAEIAQIEDQVPPTADLPGLFRLLQGAADQSAVDFFSFTPGVPIADATGSFSTIPSTISVNGSYFALDEYLFLLETLLRAGKVTQIAITPGTTDAGTGVSAGSLQLQLSVDFYTTDVSAGPGSIPGPSEGATATATEPTPSGTPSPTPTEAGES
ncbi:MAG TPA: type 4a pilus biogenesis protein PilO [Actinomycetota bacterium]|nr:type 4a pilus biogenesis protein PilO [Actinomycetota bacterium]